MSAQKRTHVVDHVREHGVALVGRHQRDRQVPWVRDYFEHVGSSNPTRRIGTPADVAGAVLFAMTNTFLTGVTLKIDGGEPLT